MTYPAGGFLHEDHLAKFLISLPYCYLLTAGTNTQPEAIMGGKCLFLAYRFQGKLHQGRRSWLTPLYIHSRETTSSKQHWHTSRAGLQICPQWHTSFSSALLARDSVGSLIKKIWVYGTIYIPPHQYSSIYLPQFFPLSPNTFTTFYFLENLFAYVLCF